MMKLAKRNNITDKLELEQYNHLVGVCEQAKSNAQTRPTDMHSARMLVWPYYDAYRRAAGMDAPPEHLLIDPLVASWPAIREKCRLAAEAYAELLDTLRSP